MIPASTTTTPSASSTDSAGGDAQLPAPTNATEWAYAILLTLGIDPTKNTNSVADLAAQINLEQGSNNVSGFNPLNSTQKEGSSVGGGSQGNIQRYTNWQDGLQGNVAVLLQSNQSPIYQALVNNATISQYATAVGNAHWITTANGGPNQSYGLAIASRYNAMAKQASGYFFAPVSAAYTAFFKGGITYSVPTGTASGPGISDLPAAAAGIAGTLAENIAPFSDVSSFFKFVGSGLGIGWASVGSILVGIALVILGILFIFHQTTAKAATAAMSAAA